MHEIDVMKSVKHPNIVGLIGHSTAQNQQMMIIIEYCSKGNLLNYLRWKNRGGFTFNLITVYFAEKSGKS